MLQGAGRNLQNVGHEWGGFRLGQFGMGNPAAELRGRNSERPQIPVGVRRAGRVGDITASTDPKDCLPGRHGQQGAWFGLTSASDRKLQTFRQQRMDLIRARASIRRNVDRRDRRGGQPMPAENISAQES